MPDQLPLIFGIDAWLGNLSLSTVIAFAAILLALAFDFVNGFNDTANACATVIYTRALKPGTAILLSGVLNFLGALLVGTAVAQVITKIIPIQTVNLSIVVAVLIAALIWNLTTWWLRIPISSSHCLIGSLFGAGLMAAGVNGVAWTELAKVLAALITSPIIGFIAGGLITWAAIKMNKNDFPAGRSIAVNAKTTSISVFGINPRPSLSLNDQAPEENQAAYNSSMAVLTREQQPISITKIPITTETATTSKRHHTAPIFMRWLHILACSMVAFSHGSNDGQKTMGIITLILATHFAAYGYTINHVPFWVIAACAIAIGLGTTIGGWRIIKTVGTKISKQPITHTQGFGASMATALVILVASRIGAPISTTHTLNSAVAGGTIPCYGFNKLNSKTMRTILMAWVLTVPAAATLSAICYSIIKLISG